MFYVYVFDRKHRPEDEIQYMIAEKADRKSKAYVNREFFAQLRELLSKFASMYTTRVVIQLF